MRLERFLAYLALAICSAWAIAYVDFPFGWDQGITAWIGNIICEGGVPYRDGWDCSGPVSYFIPAVAQSLFGRSTHSLRILDLIFLLAATGTLTFVVARLTNRFCAAWTGIVFFLWYASGSYWHTAQRDGWTAMLMAIGLGPLLIVARQRMLAAMFTAGMTLGIVVLIKPVFGPFLLVPLLVIGDQLRSRDWLLSLASIVCLAIGAAVPVAATVAWFTYHGALSELVEVYVMYPRRIYAASVQPSWIELLGEIGHALRPGRPMFVVVPFAVVGAYSLFRTDRRRAVYLVLWLLLAIAGAVIQKRFFLYHWLPAYPPLVILLGLGIDRLQRAAADVEGPSASARRWRFTFGACLTLLLLQLAAHPIYDVYSSTSYALGVRSRERYLQRFGAPADEVAAAERLAELTTPDDYVLVWGWNTNILNLAHRKSPTRFGFSMPLLMGAGTETRDRYRVEFMQALASVPVKYVVLGEVAEKILGDSFDLNDFPEFYEYLTQNFQPERDLGRVQIWSARSRAVPLADGGITAR